MHVQAAFVTIVTSVKAILEKVIIHGFYAESTTPIQSTTSNNGEEHSSSVCEGMYVYSAQILTYTTAQK